ncbi:MAG: hypothetical protein NTY48_06675 [Candidatus Diapherotrites archaeon]|nr:hypothetical protein [Candidatus Diapherotrites archaeon]
MTSLAFGSVSLGDIGVAVLVVSLSIIAVILLFLFFAKKFLALRYK